MPGLAGEKDCEMNDTTVTSSFIPRDVDFTVGCAIPMPNNSILECVCMCVRERKYVCMCICGSGESKRLLLGEKKCVHRGPNFSSSGKQKGEGEEEERPEQTNQDQFQLGVVGVWRCPSQRMKKGRMMGKEECPR